MSMRSEKRRVTSDPKPMVWSRTSRLVKYFRPTHLTDRRLNERFFHTMSLLSLWDKLAGCNLINIYSWIADGEISNNINVSITLITKCGVFVCRAVYKYLII